MTRQARGLTFTIEAKITIINDLKLCRLSLVCGTEIIEYILHLFYNDVYVDCLGNCVLL